ncbi:uncharacterized protein F5147DRAFT_654633 [Suillus discolor]|uniref:CxC2-like cysteine cluster KDZ transposase-associated domain-containing protein n=1 Tax=Suillus discolor TaxID=1912936 RepID=A0A9P7JRM5_9AGAM|nr:uncharacterized protein F5147DRAFT_654633 [Suillus discolor]KAG2103721.1 hypothetical protein F5147DRAFT_654633 [Suillus discolor]
MVIWLGHGGNACPWEDDPGELDFFATGEGSTDSTDAEGTADEETGAPSSKDAHDLPTGVPFIKNSKAMTTIVDKSGVHTHIIKYCTCPDATTANIQLFEMGLFAASFVEPKTAFTIGVLDDFLLDNLECGTSAMNYYSKLRRMTTSVFPHTVPDRYRELMRVARQWRKLKLLKWNGFGHKEKEVRPGDLALFCPACPQPGINLTVPTGDVKQARDAKDAYDLETPSWLYTRSLVMDGNFKAEHLYAKNPANEVSLMDGRGFMVGNHIYKKHLAVAKDAIQQSECNNHRAVNQANTSCHKLEATGISGCACARHGCFVPHAMVDFQKGERQINMDYALCEALKVNAEGIRRVLTFYDVNCQYHKNLKECITNSPFLEIPMELDIVPGIGLWHVYGHQDNCYVRYASNFIKGAARIDGEIMETLWVPLNIISPAARGMGTPHRKECLDYQMNDCNFMKMIRMSKSLCQKYKEAVKGVAESKLAFERLDESADADKVRDWEAQDRSVQEWRSQDSSVMDIYEVQLQKAPTRKQQELQLLAAQGQHPGPVRWRGVVTWIAEGLTIEEAQVTLQMEVKQLGRQPTDSQRLQISRRRDTLQRDIDRWVEAGATFIGDELGDDNTQIMEQDLLILGEVEDEMKDEGRFFEPEKVLIPLPSNLGLEKCSALGIANLGQANDALHNIRVHLADKAVIFRKTVRVAKSQAMATRAWAQVHSVDRARYQILAKEHLKVSTAVADPNTRGQRNDVLPWFWSLDVQRDSDSSEWLNEFYHVHWLRAKALRDRWAEAILLVEHEMEWTCNFFHQKGQEWIYLGATCKQCEKGHLAYAARQCKIYECLFTEARHAFDRIKANVSH